MAKEWILNLATNRWGLNKKRSVGPVALWIREAAPRSVEDWEQAYLQRLGTLLQERGIPLSPEEYLHSLGTKLYTKVTEVVRAEIDQVTEEDRVAYIRNLVIDRCRRLIVGNNGWCGRMRRLPAALEGGCLSSFPLRKAAVNA